MREFCECTDDGYCTRYQREMSGRFRELCRGINVDLGTAAAFREQWAREVGPSEVVSTTPPMSLLLKTSQAPGDAVAMTAAVWSLHRAHPGRYTTAVESYWPDVFAHNPDVSAHLLPTSTVDGVQAVIGSGIAEVRMHYPAIHESNERGIHFMQGWCEHLGAALGVNVPLLTNRPRLYWPPSDTAPLVGDYWLVCSGGKRDFTNKLWGHHNYQEVVDRLRGAVRFVQVGGARPPVPWAASCLGSQEDDHSRLDGAMDVVGGTTLRELFDMARAARGVLCGVSLLMHVAAAVGRPAVVVAGGREPVAWNAYPKQHYLHTVGALPCRDAAGHAGGACWRARVRPLGDGTALDRDTCERPSGAVPGCMEMIRPAEVAGLILRYNESV